MSLCLQEIYFQLDLFEPFDFTNKQAMADYERHVNQQIGILIRTLRRKQGLTQKTLGQMLGVTYQQIQKYEAGRSSISMGKFSILMKKLHY